MISEKKINVLMVTGVYLPEINGAVRQCSQLINQLKEEINFSVLAGTNIKSHDEQRYINNVLIKKIYNLKQNKIKSTFNFARFILYFIGIIKFIDIIHVHGYSIRNAIIIIIGRIYRKKIIIKMTSYGKDDPLSIKNKNLILWKIFKLCDIYIGISPAFQKSFNSTDLSKKKFRFIPNGVDLNKYFPISNIEKKILRSKFGYKDNDKIIIFVGHFSYEKRPKLIYDTWVKINEKNKNTKLIFIGKTKNNFEVDLEIKERIIIDAQLRGIMEDISFVEETDNVDEYMKISDVFALMSLREGMPNVLIEAMACGLPSLVNEILDVTDWLVKDGETGLLFNSKDPNILAEKIIYLLIDKKNYFKMSMQSKQFVQNNFSAKETSSKILNLYKSLR